MEIGVNGVGNCICLSPARAWERGRRGCNQALHFAAVLLLPAREQGKPSGPRIQSSPCAHQFFFLHSFLLTHIALLCVRLRIELISSSQPPCELSTVLKALFHLGKMRLRSEFCPCFEFCKLYCLSSLWPPFPIPMHG